MDALWDARNSAAKLTLHVAVHPTVWDPHITYACIPSFHDGQAHSAHTQRTDSASLIVLITANLRTRQDEGMCIDHVSSNSVSFQTSIYSRIPPWIVTTVKSKRIRTRIMAGNKYVDLQARLRPLPSRSCFNVFLECTVPMTFNLIKPQVLVVPNMRASFALGPFPGQQTY